MSQVQVTFTGGELSDVAGELVRMSSVLPEDPTTAQQVAQMQADLEADPEFAALFESIGEASVELDSVGSGARICLCNRITQCAGPSVRGTRDNNGQASGRLAHRGQEDERGQDAEAESAPWYDASSTVHDCSS